MKVHKIFDPFLPYTHYKRSYLVTHNFVGPLATTYVTNNCKCAREVRAPILRFQMQNVHAFIRVLTIFKIKYHVAILVVLYRIIVHQWYFTVI